MRTNIDIDDTLMRQAMRLGGADTKKATVETALRLLIQTRSQAGMGGVLGERKKGGEIGGICPGRDNGEFGWVLLKTPVCFYILEGSLNAENGGAAPGK